MVNSCLRIELRLLPRLCQQRLGRVVQRLGALPGQILDLEFEAAGGRDAGDRRRIEAERDRVRDRQQLGTDRGDDTAMRVSFAPRSAHGFSIANSTAEFD